jgi:hypothetical protein
MRGEPDWRRALFGGPQPQHGIAELEMFAIEVQTFISAPQEPDQFQRLLEAADWLFEAESIRFDVLALSRPEPEVETPV